MKFILVLSFLSMISDINLNVVTNKTFDSIEECQEHEMFFDSMDINFSVLCIPESDMASFTEEVPTLDFRFVK